MPDVVFVKDPAGWEDMVRGPKGLVARDLLRRGRRLTMYARHQVGFDSGQTYRRMGYALMPYRNSLQMRVGSDSKVALIHHEGTRPHVIRPRRARVLRFARYGRINYRMRVFHPGTKPNRYLTDNLPRVVLD